ncbi:MAG: hypothetical protein P8178_15730 [Candidatus Thiodiazotropha sp.]
MKIYLVGGAVRDRLLDLPVSERDWVVVGATPEQMLEQGFRRADADFPVFLHPQTGEEYALARTEVKTGPGYKGFAVESGPQVTLEQDLLRRDLTINALAMDEAGELIDPCGGRDDLENGLLRHITPAFSEDPVRLLRVARFAAKLGRWGFRVAHGTHGLMQKMAASPDLANLRAERVWRELVRAMGEPQPWRFFEVLHRCGALARLMPPLDRLMGDPAAATVRGSHRSARRLRRDPGRGGAAGAGRPSQAAPAGTALSAPPADSPGALARAAATPRGKPETGGRGAGREAPGGGRPRVAGGGPGSRADRLAGGAAGGGTRPGQRRGERFMIESRYAR